QTAVKRVKSAKAARKIATEREMKRIILPLKIDTKQLPERFCPLSVQIEFNYRAWIRTMNNASKGRCVTVTPRGKTEDETLKAKPGLGKRQMLLLEEVSLRLDG